MSISISDNDSVTPRVEALRARLQSVKRNAEIKFSQFASQADKSGTGNVIGKNKSNLLKNTIERIKSSSQEEITPLTSPLSRKNKKQKKDEIA